KGSAAASTNAELGTHLKRSASSWPGPRRTSLKEAVHLGRFWKARSPPSVRQRLPGHRRGSCSVASLLRLPIHLWQVATTGFLFPQCCSTVLALPFFHLRLKQGGDLVTESTHLASV